MNRNRLFFALFIVVRIVTPSTDTACFAEKGRSHSARASSDSDARYLHHLVLYDDKNQKITPESSRPYSPKHTCGRCHDYATISHGWHFNAFTSASPVDARSPGDTAEDGSSLKDLAGDELGFPDGRDGEPWIWTDARTGTQLPLTYRDWSHSYSPEEIGIGHFSMVEKFGGRIPGGGLGDPNQPRSDRWKLSGKLEIDCLACHAVSGLYDINLRRDQVQKQNFSCVPTAAMRWGVIKGDVSRIKDGFDLADESTQKKLPSVLFDPRIFSPDGTVFVDLVRKPTSNACYQCHSQRTVSRDASGAFLSSRWVHDEDVHLLSGMQCVDCHRNGIDHDMVRGFPGQVSIAGTSIGTLSCEGCHLGVAHDEQPMGPLSDVSEQSGRLGSPRPLHSGLPPIHFEKLACTACHGGPLPREEAVGIMTSLAHRLGEKKHRTGEELPLIAAPVYTRDRDGKIAPHKVMWPSFWGTFSSDDATIQPLDPGSVYAMIRKSLRVRKDFTQELFHPKLKSSVLRELLGPERSKTKKEDWSPQERLKVELKQAELGKQEFNEKVFASLKAIEKTLEGQTAVFVSSGVVYAAGDQPETLKRLERSPDKATQMIAWPMAHNVRPAGWALGTRGCTECHSEDGLIFASTVNPIGPVGRAVDSEEFDATIHMASLQGLDEYEHMAWNQLFSGRGAFKYIIGVVITLTLMMLIFGLGQLFGRQQILNPRASQSRNTERSI